MVSVFETPWEYSPVAFTIIKISALSMALRSDMKMNLQVVKLF